MDRKQAQSHIGKHIIIDELANGVYIGELLDVLAEPKKPWRGLVKMKGVLSLPEQVTEAAESFLINKPIYHEDQIEEFPSTKIKVSTVEVVETYQESLITAVTSAIERCKFSIEQNGHTISGLVEYLHEINPTIAQLYKDNFEGKDDGAYVYYTVQFEHGQWMLFDQIQGQSLAANGCPFSFDFLVEGKWKKGRFLNGNTFQTVDGVKYAVASSDKFRLERSQFDPYQILINELEKPALEALERNLHFFDVTHDHVTHCHNSLLLNLLHSNNVKKFQGVNFITYQNQHHTIIVQHHFERSLKESKDDVFDRFEFTTDKGKRSIITYTNQYSGRN